ncbi:hypothetical protein [Clostridioides difficile]|uniref:hypothetical protein n=3 Tax=Clostridioides difficile TaxID=1496 RepID=UPI00097FD9D9|nr:hypothetical protein [Clostridioides difficile]SJT05947.1 DNA-damage-inducible protein D [Clostridioides difficile]SJT09515.1 DNA-damage-inducible protein D [Clostridioides difficile]SJT56058.1 DNA-damage-inducible protein D [Clostridioides difficile]
MILCFQDMLVILLYKMLMLEKIVDLGQIYFVQKTKDQELAENFEQLTEDRKRLAIRNELKHHNKKLVDAARDASIKTNIEYGIFQNYGYMDFYGGLKVKDIQLINV